MSPRDWDNVSVMHGACREYRLGDIQHESGDDLQLALAQVIADNAGGKYSNALGVALEWANSTHYAGLESTLGDVVDSLNGWGHDSDVYRNGKAWRLFLPDGYRAWTIQDLADKALDDSNVEIAPLWLYDHSGLSLSLGQSCPWDSGQIGFAVVTKTAAIKELGATDSTWRELASNCIRGEVATYSQYLEGDIYGYAVTDFDGEVVDSCWGFYGYSEAEKEGQEALGVAIQDARQALATDLAGHAARLASVWRGRHAIRECALAIFQETRKQCAKTHERIASL
jgi:hypothetical protein